MPSLIFHVSSDTDEITPAAENVAAPAPYALIVTMPALLTDNSGVVNVLPPAAVEGVNCQEAAYRLDEILQLYKELLEIKSIYASLFPLGAALPSNSLLKPVAAPRLVSPVALNVVNAPVLAVVAPTVPLMLMLAVPVRLVTVPLDGVPRAPPLTTNAPAVPVFTPSAVTTPVPVVMVDGATPAPPPCTNEPAASAADVAQVVALEK